MELGKGSYLCRCSIWDWHDNSTSKIMDENGNYIARLDEWQTLVFFMADGSNDIEEIIDTYIDRRGKLTEYDFRHQILASGSTSKRAKEQWGEQMMLFIIELVLFAIHQLQFRISH